MILTWKKNGVKAALVGIRNTRTDELRPLTQADIDDFIKNFKGADTLEEPFVVQEGQ